MDDVLDNPAWSALMGAHAHLALRAGGAARYPAAMSPIAALSDPAAPDIVSLKELSVPGDVIGFLAVVPIDPTDGWELDRRGIADQMVCRVLPSARQDLGQLLGEPDVPDMLALIAATDPGPFREQTIRMGRYHGVRDDGGHLVAMAGERLAPDGYVEISAVCTLPEFRGRGLASGLVSGLAARILGEGRVPFLHATPGNPAVRLYESLGFSLRRKLHLSVIRLGG